MNNSIVFPKYLGKLTNKSLDIFNFWTNDISKITNSLDPDETHSRKILSIKIIKLCANSICKLLAKISNDCLKEENLLLIRKKAYVVPFQKKMDKQ